MKNLFSILLLSIVFTQMQAQQKEYSFLFIGDSYTIGEGVAANENYPSQLVAALTQTGIKLKTLKIVAKTGWTTAELMQAALAENDYTKYDLVFLCIGVNNQYRGQDIGIYKKELNALINYSLMATGDKAKNVILISIPDYGFTPFGGENKSKISAEIDAYNTIKKDQAYIANAQFVNITQISRNEDATMITSDGLHPSAKQYAMWVKEILPLALTRLK